MLQVYYIKMPVGAGRCATKLNDVQKRSIIVINNNDNLCLPRALAVGMVYVACKAQDCTETRAKWLVICDGRRKMQKEHAERLVADAGVNIPSNGCSFEELTNFQNFFLARGIALVVFEKQYFGSGEPPLFDGRNTLHELNIALSGIITNLFGAAGMCFFCSYCNKGFRYVNQHKCARTCESCYVSPACRNAQVEMIECVDCGRQFFGHECFANHKRAGSYKKKKIRKSVRSCAFV